MERELGWPGMGSWTALEADDVCGAYEIFYRQQDELAVDAQRITVARMLSGEENGNNRIAY